MADPLYLSPGVRGVTVDDHVVLLDVAADRYILLPHAAALVGLGPDGALHLGDAAAADMLLASGLASATPPVKPPEAPPPLPARTAAASLPPPLTLGLTWRLACVLADAWLHYRGRSFAQILAYVRRQAGEAPRPTDAARVTRLAAQFASAAVWLPAPRKCLVRSFLLLRWLQRSGADARWVFAVRTSPFAAHCWLQVGDTVLDDEADRLLGYRPIHVV